MSADRELVLTRRINAPRERVYRCWTEPELMKQWFAPLPWTTPHVEVDERPGGSATIVMRGPDGNDMPNHGVYLEVVPNQRLVSTDAFTRAWEPSEKPFMTLILTFVRWRCRAAAGSCRASTRRVRCSRWSAAKPEGNLRGA
jgi:uncharacterized protein YndB with AHSA1/START domain